MDKQTEIAITNWEHYKSLCKFITRKNSLAQMLSSLHEDEGICITAPASTKSKFTRCYPGGLVEQILSVTKTMIKLRTAYELTEANVPKESILLAGLFHSVGRFGSKELGGAYYIPNDSKWGDQKFSINEPYRMFSPSILSLKLLSKHVDLTVDEWGAIYAFTPKATELDTELYGNNDTNLSLLLKHSVARQCMVGREKNELELVKLV